MQPSLKPLRAFAHVSAALGLLSITLTREIAAGWLVASWSAWAFSVAAGQRPRYLLRSRGFETAAVAGMIVVLLVDFFAFHTTIFIAITHFLLLFQIVKLVGEKARKDCLQVFIFSFFQILAACTLSVDAWHAAILIGLIPTATAMLFWNQIDQQWEQAGLAADAAMHRRYRRMITGICLVAFPCSLVVTLSVFVIFPRLTLNVALPGFAGRGSGYTDRVNLAQKGRIQQDASVVLWLSFPNPEERGAWSGYLRGGVLSHFDGRRWTVSKEQGSRMITPDSNGIFLLKAPRAGAPRIHQTITLADTSAATLFAIDKPVRIRAPLPALQQNDEGSLQWLSSWRRPLRYEAVSELVTETETPGSNPAPLTLGVRRIRDLAQSVAGTGPALEQAQKIELYLQKQYRYSDNFGDHVPENPVDYFLFERREGSCGHFASAMALMLRLRNIPSRLVAGYLKGEWNEPAQSVVIRQQDAHAWVEAYIEGKGWVPFDPSPRQAAGGAARKSWLHAAAQYGIYLEFLWNRFVIQYDLYAQIRAFETLKGTSDRVGSVLSTSWARLQQRFQRPQGASTAARPESASPAGFSVKKGAAALALVLLSFFLLQKTRAPDGGAIRFYGDFLRDMARAGCPKLDWETGQEFVSRLIRQKPEHSALARQITKRYYQVRFRKGLL